MEPPAEGVPTREKSRRSSGAASTAVPTEERALAPSGRWSTTMDGVRLRMTSTCGRS